MLPPNNPDRIRIVFDDHRLVANAGLLLSATLAQHLGLRELVDHHLDLGGAPGQHGGQDADAGRLRLGSASTTPMRCAPVGRSVFSAAWSRRHPPWAPSCAAFAGGMSVLDRVSRQLLARAWAAGAGPGDSPLTIDLDSTICETYGLAKEGARHHGYTGARGYHPLLAIAAAPARC